MPEGVLELTGPVTIELVLDPAIRLGAGLDRGVEGRVDVLDVHADGHGGAADRLRPQVAHVGVLVREHDHRISDLQFGVADLAVGPVHAHALLGSEHLCIEIDGPGGAVDDEVRADLRVAVGDGLHGRAHAADSFIRSGSFGFIPGHKGERMFAA